jgi:hypothetical protein
MSSAGFEAPAPTLHGTRVPIGSVSHWLALRAASAPRCTGVSVAASGSSTRRPPLTEIGSWERTRGAGHQGPVLKTPPGSTPTPPL